MDQIDSYSKFEKEKYIFSKKINKLNTKIVNELLKLKSDL